MEILETAIAAISPTWALKRARNRAALDVIQKRYKAGKNGRRGSSWNVPSSSANSAIGLVLQNLRNRSRDLMENNPYVKKAVEVMAANIVGTGIRPSFNFDDERLETILANEWRKWAEKSDVDFDGIYNLYAIQDLAIITTIVSGECLILRRRDNRGGKMNYSLQLLEGDYLDNGHDGTKYNDGSYDRMGIKFDRSGRRVGYWIYHSHPSETWRTDIKSRLVPAEDVIHVFYKARPGQDRGVPWGHASFIRANELDRTEDARIMQQMIAACFAAFVHDNGADPSVMNPTGDDPDLEYERIEPGRVEKLPPGKNISFANPPSVEGFPDFAKHIVRGISAGFGISYEAVSNDFSNVNFSSARMAWIEMQRAVRRYQLRVATPMLNKIFSWFMEAAEFNKVVDQEDSDKIPTWTMPGREILDPVKEATGTAKLLDANLITWSEAIRQSGKDPDEVIMEMKSDRSKFEAAGLEYTFSRGETINIIENG